MIHVFQGRNPRSTACDNTKSSTNWPGQIFPDFHDLKFWADTRDRFDLFSVHDLYCRFVSRYKYFRVYVRDLRGLQRCAHHIPGATCMTRFFFARSCLPGGISARWNGWCTSSLKRKVWDLCELHDLCLRLVLRYIKTGRPGGVSGYPRA